MKKIISLFLAALIVITGLSFPVFANETEEIVTITADMISAEGASVEYDSYLSAYKITPDAAGEQVAVRLTENLYSMAIWLPATAADSSLEIIAENDLYISSFTIEAGHKFEFTGVGFEGENFWMNYIPSDTYSIYVFDKMADGYCPELADLANGTLAQYEEEYLDLSDYEVERYTKYYWDGDIVFNESFFVLEEKDGTIAPNAMMYEIDRVVSVKNSYLNREYVYGTDYLVEDGKLVIPEGSAIRSYAYSTVYKDSDPTNSYWDTLDGKYVYAGQYDMYFVGYMNITYTVKNTWDGPKPEAKGIYLEKISEKLNTPGETVKLLGLGDSIAGGANVSGDIGETGVSPYADPWAEMTSKAIQERYPYITIEYDVIAQGGATATYAIERMNDIIAYDPDLIMIEFGTNECMAGETPEYYLNTLKQAIAAINENLPDCDIILVAPIISNPLIFPADWFYAYADALYTLERQGVAIADSTSVLQYLLSKKDYIDMTGDFLCHPNDFANRVFVQTILKTLETGTAEDFIAGLAHRVTTYRYEAEYDEADWAELCRLSEIASADILASADCNEAREKFIGHIAILDAIPTSAENVANSALDPAKLVFNTAKPMDTVSATNNVSATYSETEKALSAYISNTRNPSITLDYNVCDTIADAADYDYVVFTAKAPLTNSTKAKQTKITYTTAAGACAVTTIDLILDGAYHSYIIDMSADANWTGSIQNLKLQPFASSTSKDTLFVSSIVLATDSENAADIAVERERVANGNAAEAVTYLMSDDTTCAILKTEGESETYIAGDANGDGKITATDSLLLRRSLVDASTAIANAKALDVNRDGAIDAKDSAALRATLAEKIAPVEVGGAPALISYSTTEKAAEIKLNADNVAITADLTSAGLSADMFKYVTVCAKSADGEYLDVAVTLTYADGNSTKTVTVPATELFNAETAKFTEATGDILSITFTFDAAAGETVYLDSFVFTATLSAADNAEVVRVGAANLS